MDSWIICTYFFFVHVDTVTFFAIRITQYAYGITPDLDTLGNDWYCMQFAMTMSILSRASERVSEHINNFGYRRFFFFLFFILNIFFPVSFYCRNRMTCPNVRQFVTNLLREMKNKNNSVANGTKMKSRPVFLRVTFQLKMIFCAAVWEVFIFFLFFFSASFFVLFSVSVLKQNPNPNPNLSGGSCFCIISHFVLQLFLYRKDRAPCNSIVSGAS